jgi:proteasome alpha subunit
VGEVGFPHEESHAQLFRISYDGSIVDESTFVVMGGTTEPISDAMTKAYKPGLELQQALRTAVDALAASGEKEEESEGKREISGLEVALLEQARPRRAFRRITGEELDGLLQ